MADQEPRIDIEAIRRDAENAPFVDAAVMVHANELLEILDRCDFVRDDDGRALLPKNSERLDTVRSQLSGYHFSKESLAPETVRVLYMAEALLEELDRRAGGYAH
jgi:hypothetical protein